MLINAYNQFVHNINYWNNKEYYGFGLGAVSYLNNYRISNTRNINRYNEGNYLLDSIYEDESLNMSNDMILGLRKLEGVSITDFYNKYKKNITSVFNIDDLIKQEIILINDDRLYINPLYVYLSNQVLVRFIDINKKD